MRISSYKEEEIIQQIIYIAKLWNDVCDAMNDDDAPMTWEEIKGSYLKDWNKSENISVEFWSSYMQAMMMEYGTDLYYTRKRADDRGN